MEDREPGPLSEERVSDEFARLYQRTALALMTYVRRHVSSREDAEDIVLEVYLASLRQQGLAHMNEEQQMAWLQRVAYFKYVDLVRARNVRKGNVPLDTMADRLLADERQEPEAVLLRHEEDMQLRQRLSELPPNYQKILQLRFAFGLRTREIAQMMQKSDGAIRMLLVRALNTLREQYTRR